MLESIRGMKDYLNNFAVSLASALKDAGIAAPWCGKDEKNNPKNCRIPKLFPFDNLYVESSVDK